MSQPLSITIAGAAGRMGQVLRRLVTEAEDLALAGALEAPGRQDANADITADPVVALQGAQVLVEFTTAESTAALAHAAAERGVALVSGTTGLDAAAEAALDAAAERAPVLWAPNMSLGVNLLFALTEQVARALPAGYDPEILELHHRHKRDAPSGTALGLLRAIRVARPEGADRFGRHGLGAPRPADEVGVHAVRGGEVVGEHHVFFLGSTERVTLAHQAQSRDAFALGALQAARWLAGRAPGRYTMRDVLGL